MVALFVFTIIVIIGLFLVRRWKNKGTIIVIYSVNAINFFNSFLYYSINNILIDIVNIFLNLYLFISYLLRLFENRHIFLFYSIIRQPVTFVVKNEQFLHHAGGKCTATIRVKQLIFILWVFFVILVVVFCNSMSFGKMSSQFYLSFFVSSSISWVSFTIWSSPFKF